MLVLVEICKLTECKLGELTIVRWLDTADCIYPGLKVDCGKDTQSSTMASHGISAQNVLPCQLTLLLEEKTWNLSSVGIYRLMRYLCNAMTHSEIKLAEIRLNSVDVFVLNLNV